MSKFEPKYVEYQNRILNGILGMLVMVVIVTFLLFFNDIDKFSIITVGIVCTLIFMITLFALIGKSKKYLRFITIGEEEIIISLCEKDKEPVVQECKLDDVRIKVVLLFFSFTRWGNNYKLQIDVKQNGKFEPVVEQHEIGNWNLNLFKQVSAAYCQAKNLPCNLSSLKRTNFL